ncbi:MULTISPECIES: DUF1090 family protein [unclassified Providencia]|uniref:DUF1090 family protein n=1 Tax=unclassified Providencia TaxID=2633465 RepID=UPI000E8A2266|nr:DUF1090 family protein [Providencia sp.]MBP6082246.1 DUF1090 family protein [Providencia sp.]HBO23843.1 DUF1090 domain-containing protein [Providencia sp.]
MNKAVLLVLAVMLIPLSSQAGSKNHGCEKKVDKLESQLYSAIHHGNRHKVAKLKKKIHETRFDCYDRYNRYDSRSGATKIRGYYPQQKSSELERELESLRRVIDALNDLK